VGPIHRKALAAAEFLKRKGLRRLSRLEHNDRGESGQILFNYPSSRTYRDPAAHRLLEERSQRLRLRPREAVKTSGRWSDVEFSIQSCEWSAGGAILSRFIL
jgi:hypothetical protein